MQMSSLRKVPGSSASIIQITNNCGTTLGDQPRSSLDPIIHNNIRSKIFFKIEKESK